MRRIIRVVASVLCLWAGTRTEMLRGQSRDGAPIKLIEIETQAAPADVVAGSTTEQSGDAPQVDATKPSALLVMNVDGSERRELTDQAGWYFGSPAWSHDGKFVAYDAWQASPQNYRNAQIFKIHSDGSGRQPLGQGAMPSWSPDDERLAFHSYERDLAVGHMSADGRDISVIAHSGNSPRWSPTSPQIAWADGSEGANLLLMDLQTRATRRLLADGWNPYWGFAWSPDGRRIAMPLREEESARPNAVVVARVQATGPAQELIVCARGAEVFTSVDWAPDGKTLLFALRTDGNANFQLYTVSVDVEEEPRLFPGQDPLRNNVSADYSPDGRQIVFVSATGKL